jgi:hypothetical protein
MGRCLVHAGRCRMSGKWIGDDLEDDPGGGVANPIVAPQEAGNGVAYAA